MKIKLFILIYFIGTYSVLCQSTNDDSENNRQNNSKIDIYFLGFRSVKEKPETKVYKNRKKILEMYDKYNAERLPMRIAENGEIEVIVSCEDVLNIGVCIPLTIYDKISIESILKVEEQSGSGKFLERNLIENVSEDSTKIKERTSDDPSLKDDNKDTPKGLIFYRLEDLFKDAYQTKQKKESELCCPDTKNLSPEEILKDKLCIALESPEGITLKTLGSKKSTQVILRSLGLGRKNIEDGERLQKIEPRQYVTIYEKKELNGKAEAIWWLEKKADPILKIKYPEYNSFILERYTKFYPQQKHSVIDEKSLVEIKFDQEMLAKNINFYGNISLAATLNSNPIEVSPYSVIGKPQKSYGVNSKPIKEIASHFLDLMIKANTVGNLYRRELKSLYDSRRTPKTKEELLTKLREELNDVKWNLEEIENEFKDMRIPAEFISEQLNQKLKEVNINPEITIRELESQVVSLDTPKLLNEFKKVLEKYYNENFSAKTYYPFYGELVYGNLKIGEVKSIIDDLNEGYYSFQKLKRLQKSVADILSKDNINTYLMGQINVDTTTIDPAQMNLYNQYIDGLSLCIQYMDYFRSSGDESMKAFLSLSHITQIEFDNYYQIIKSNYTDLEKEGLNLIKTFSDTPSFTTNYIKIEKINHILNQLQKGINSVIDEELKRLLQNQLDVQGFLEYEGASKYQKDINFEETEIFKAIGKTNIYIKFQENISYRAGMELFNRMLYATIDLKKAGASNNDILEIKVMWYNIDPNTPNAEEGIELSTAKFIVKKTGWHLSTTESVLLIDRINQELVQNDVSPSNFKPTAGVSLLWSYYNDYRKNKPRHRLEPSFGINVSYLDFDTQETFEIGAGPIIGLWNNRIFINAGYNFSVSGQSPLYMGIGFSFSNVVQKIKEGGKLKDNLDE